MALDPESQRLIDLMAAANRPAWNTLSPQAARDLYLSLRPGAQGPRPAHVTVVDRTIPGPAGNLPVRIYRPTAAAADAKLPALVYAHGGGWVFGNLDSHDVLCAQLALEAGIVVFAIDYRLAPEARFPGAFDDVVAGLKWVAANGASIGVDSSKLAIGGDSAGGNLAAVVALALRDEAKAQGTAPLRYQLLVYPATDMRRGAPSHAQNGQGYLLTQEMLAWYHGHYMGSSGRDDDWRASPLLHPQFQGLPPALIITAGYDPLRDEGLQYAQALSEAGVPCTHLCFERQLHGFLLMGRVLEEAHTAVALCAAELKRALFRP